MTAKEIKTACEKRLPVVYQRPNEEPILCDRIIEIVFRPLQSGRWQCSVILPDPCGHSTIRAWCGHVSLPNGVSLPKDKREVA